MAFRLWVAPDGFGGTERLQTASGRLLTVLSGSGWPAFRSLLAVLGCVE